MMRNFNILSLVLLVFMQNSHAMNTNLQQTSGPSETTSNGIKLILGSPSGLYYDKSYKKYICLKTFTTAYRSEKQYGCSMPTAWSSTDYSNKNFFIDRDVAKAVFEDLERRFEGKTS